MFLAVTLFILACSQVVLGNPASDMVADIKSSVDHVHGLVASNHLVLPALHHDSGRQKRQANWNEEEDEPELDVSLICLLQCNLQLKAAAQRAKTPSAMQSFGDDDDDNNDQAAIKPVNLTRFIQACDALRPSIQCFNQCPQSNARTQIKQSLVPLQYMCIDRFQDIKTNARCMQKAGQETASQCKSRCRRYDQSVNRLKQLAKRPHARYYAPHDIRNMLSGTCHSIQCHLDCSVPVIRRACGETAAELMKGITQQLMASLQNYDSLTTGGQNLPQSCMRLAQAGGRDSSRDAEVALGVEGDRTYRRRVVDDGYAYDENQ